MKKGFRALALLCAVLCFAVGCAPATVSSTHYALDTILTLTLYDTRDDGLSQACWERADALEGLLSRTRAGSDISRINAAEGKPVEVSPETAVLLRSCLEVCAASDGAFDITLGRVTELWDFAADSPSLPDEAALREALTFTGWEKVVLQGNTVTVPAGMKLDLGAAAKGHIGDELQRLLEEKGCGAALLNLGGNLVTLGRKKGGDPWKLGIRDPEGTAQDSLCTVTLPGSGTLVTSGVYERCFTLEGKRYHHLLDPKTGYPAESGLLSVSVTAPTSALADMLSTACFVLGPEKGLALLETTPGAEGLFVKEDGSTVMTDSMKALIGD